jgi:hypothetical protein
MLACNSGFPQVLGLEIGTTMPGFCCTVTMRREALHHKQGPHPKGQGRGTLGRGWNGSLQVLVSSLTIVERGKAVRTCSLNVS